MAIIFPSKNPDNILARIIAIFFDKILANLNILPKIIHSLKKQFPPLFYS